MKRFKFLTEIRLTDEDRHNIVWRTHTGRCTPLIWMTTSHIKNCLRCLMGQGHMTIPDFYEGKNRNEWIEIFESELSIRESES